MKDWLSNGNYYGKRSGKEGAAVRPANPRFLRVCLIVISIHLKILADMLSLHIIEF